MEFDGLVLHAMAHAVATAVAVLLASSTLNMVVGKPRYSHDCPLPVESVNTPPGMEPCATEDAQLGETFFKDCMEPDLQPWRERAPQGLSLQKVREFILRFVQEFEYSPQSFILVKGGVWYYPFHKHFMHRAPAAEDQGSAGAHGQGQGKHIRRDGPPSELRVCMSCSSWHRPCMRMQQAHASVALQCVRPALSAMHYHTCSLHACMHATS